MLCLYLSVTKCYHSTFDFNNWPFYCVVVISNNAIFANAKLIRENMHFQLHSIMELKLFGGLKCKRDFKQKELYLRNETTIRF